MAVMKGVSSFGVHDWCLWLGKRRGGKTGVINL